MTDEAEVDFVSRVGGAILLAETQWTSKAGISKERAMALAAIEAMREPTEAMRKAFKFHGMLDGDFDDAMNAMINAALSRNQNEGAGE